MTERQRVALVADDNGVARYMLVQQVNALGLRTVQAANGVEALQRLDAEDIDILFLDVLMPELDGFGVLKRMREVARLREIPVVVVSGIEEVKTAAACIEAGAEDYLTKPIDVVLLRARVRSCLEKKALREAERRAYEAVERAQKDLEIRNDFIRSVFGRYLSDEIVTNLLETPDGLNLGGEARRVTILMSDLRGFTPLCEGLPPEKVVALLNTYLGEMTDVIARWNGTIDEILGDALLVVFGAPISREDDARRAVCCALEMQLAMPQVNARLQKAGLPTLEMGIGVHTGTVVAGNIGSAKRVKYGVVGTVVNTTSRIESYTVGGQVLVSADTRDALVDQLRVRQERIVRPKGLAEGITVFDVVGIGALTLDAESVPTAPLREDVLIHFRAVTGTDAAAEPHAGVITRFSRREAEIRGPFVPELLTNVAGWLASDDGTRLSMPFYAKVVTHTAEQGRFVVRFTSVPQELVTFVESLQ